MSNSISWVFGFWNAGKHSGNKLLKVFNDILASLGPTIKAFNSLFTYSLFVLTFRYRFYENNSSVILMLNITKGCSLTVKDMVV